MVLKVSVPCSQWPATGSYSEPDSFSPHLLTLNGLLYSENSLLPDVNTQYYPYNTLISDYVMK